MIWSRIWSIFMHNMLMSLRRASKYNQIFQKALKKVCWRSIVAVFALVENWTLLFFDRLSRTSSTKMIVCPRCWLFSFMTFCVLVQKWAPRTWKPFSITVRFLFSQSIRDKLMNCALVVVFIYGYIQDKDIFERDYQTLSCKPIAHELVPGLLFLLVRKHGDFMRSIIVVGAYWKEHDCQAQDGMWLSMDKQVGRSTALILSCFGFDELRVGA